MPPDVGSTIAHYDVTALIGEGRMDQVYASIMVLDGDHDETAGFAVQASKALANVRVFRGEPGAFRSAADRALALNPRDTANVAWMALVLEGLTKADLEITG